MSIATITRNSNDYGVYATVAEADIYLEPDPELGDNWEEVTDINKERRLIAATRRLDRFVWLGEKTGGRAQDLAWPRTGLKYADGTAIATDELPREIELGAILLAGDLDIDLAASAGGSAQAVRGQTIGRKSEMFFYNEVSSLEELLPESIFEQLRLWLGRRRLLIGPTVTGRTEKEESEFSEDYSRQAWNSVG